jgi:hypothetical protein
VRYAEGQAELATPEEPNAAVAFATGEHGQGCEDYQCA